MPFFTDKLLHRKTCLRKIGKTSATFQDDCLYGDTVTLKLGDFETTFDNGQWIPQFGPYAERSKENLSLKKQINQLEEENNLLKLKYEILLDMVRNYENQKTDISQKNVFEKY